MTDAPAESIELVDGSGQNIPVDTRPGGGPPWSLSGEVDSPPDDEPWRIEVRRADEPVACRELKQRSTRPGTGEWSRPVEAFYSAWVERLFDAPVNQDLAFRSLEPVLRDPDRNFLHNHLGGNEDAHLPAMPDCADLPYFLRTYFAWKIGLPVAYRTCDRGTANRPPHCGSPVVDQRFTPQDTRTGGKFTELMRRIADTVHSGSARTALEDEATDFYPVSLQRDTLWPGTVYADPYGHTLIIAKWIPQTETMPGVLFAVDAQPDNSVARKRFWEGNFLFAHTGNAGPGFKAFRPLLHDENRAIGLPDNNWLSRSAPVATYSSQQDRLSPDDFYAAVGHLANPHGLSPEQAYDNLMDALVEQLRTRSTAVENGESWVRQHRGGVIPMPVGTSIFETMGPWEDYATPSRDMRLLIALNVITGLPDRIARYPQLFRLDGRTVATTKQSIRQRHGEQAASRRFSYTRSDGSLWELSVADILKRRATFEAGYNPNDCSEIRWGAQPETPEYATCRRHAPADQKARMEQYRPWFRDTRRPVR